MSSPNFQPVDDAFKGGNMEDELFDFSAIDEWIEEDDPPLILAETQTLAGQVHGPNTGESGGTSEPHERPSTGEIESVSQNSGARGRIAFRTRSEVEIMDDGYRWRKYGKKMVKNSPNPRNYYRCSVEGCRVKKRVERDKDDQRYVITTYEGTHNHESVS